MPLNARVAMRPAALLVAALVAGPTAAETTYNIVAAGTLLAVETFTDFGSDEFGNSFPIGGTGTSVGVIAPLSNAPMPFNRRSATYDWGTRADEGISTGTWLWESVNENNEVAYSLSGTFTTFASSTRPTQRIDFPFWSYFTGTSLITGGTGFYEGASGTATWETFQWYTGPSDPSQVGTNYFGVGVDRMTLILPGDVVVPTDDRGAAVLVKYGEEFPGQGTNSGDITTTSPSALPALTFETVQYTFDPVNFAGVQGGGTSSNDDGDSLEFTFFEPGQTNLDPSIPQLGYGRGDTQFLRGTGAYAGHAGTGTYEAFSFTTGPCGGNEPECVAYLQVVVARSAVAPVPEPQTWLLLAVGLLGGGLVAARRPRAGQRA